MALLKGPRHTALLNEKTNEKSSICTSCTRKCCTRVLGHSTRFKCILPTKKKMLKQGNYQQLTWVSQDILYILHISGFH